MDQTLLAVLAGIVQGVFEWLPISSEGNLALLFTALGTDPDAAVSLALFLHLGTGVAAAAYYRRPLADLLADLPSWRPQDAFADHPTLSFLLVATLASGVTGVASYLLLDALVTSLTGGAFVALVGLLLVAVGSLQYATRDLVADTARDPDLRDALLVGAAQGVAILPGVSRSGTTTSALLLRGHDGPDAFRLSFLLSVPAALGGAGIAYLDGGVPTLSPTSALLAVAVAVGYATIGALMRVVRRLPFWAVCVALGTLAVGGGVALAL
ncbi:MAG: undecaprenyl-diphosphate phosphatase [Haloplanus sp.]